MNLRSVGALLAISAALSCATAINDNGATGGYTPPLAGSDAGGGAGLGDEGGAPTAGAAPQAGAPSSAGKGGSGNSAGATGKGGSGNSAGATGKGGSGGTVGVAGASGASTGGKAGTSSSGAGGGSAGDGAAGGSFTALCDNPVDVPASASGNTGNFNTLEAKCFRTKSMFNNIACSNFDGRTLKINGVAATCNPAMKGTFAPSADGYIYLDASAGTNLSASVYWYTS